MLIVDVKNLEYMKFKKLNFDSAVFSDDYKPLKKIFPLFWQNFIIFEEKKLFFVLVTETLKI